MSALAVRSAGLLVPACAAAVAWRIRARDGRARTGAILGTLSAIPALVLVHALALRCGWWSFAFDGGGAWGLPVDLLAGWALAWGALPVLLAPRAPLAAVLGTLALADVALMPHAAPVVQLGPRWLDGEAAALAAVTPCLLLARWTARDVRLGARVAIQAAGFGGLLVLLVAALARRTGGWLTDVAQLAPLPVVTGLAAALELAVRGEGTPFPLDPTRRLVTTGPYSYVRNPMQAATVALLLAAALAAGSLLLAAAAVAGAAFSAGFAAWHEDAALADRFGAAWLRYRADVRAWIPRWRPRALVPATLFVDAGCATCSQVGAWIAARRPSALEVRPAQAGQRRIRYAAADGLTVEGVTAMARALDHLHLGWAWLGWAGRLPVVRQAAQLVVDASGPAPGGSPAAAGGRAGGTRPRTPRAPA